MAPNANSDPPKTTDRMSYWIGSVLENERDRFGISREEAAIALADDVRTIRAFELGETMKPKLNHYVLEYAYMTGGDPRELWQRAANRWLKEGRPPPMEVKPGPAGAFREAIREQSLQKRRQRSEPSGRRRSSP